MPVEANGFYVINYDLNSVLDTKPATQTTPLSRLHEFISKVFPVPAVVEVIDLFRGRFLDATVPMIGIELFSKLTLFPPTHRSCSCLRLELGHRTTSPATCARLSHALYDHAHVVGRRIGRRSSGVADRLGTYFPGSRRPAIIPRAFRTGIVHFDRPHSCTFWLFALRSSKPTTNIRAEKLSPHPT